MIWQDQIFIPEKQCDLFAKGKTGFYLGYDLVRIKRRFSTVSHYVYVWSVLLHETQSLHAIHSRILYYIKVLESRISTQVNDLTIAVFSFSGHQYLLTHCLRSIYSNAPEHKEIILVWDDFIDWYPVDFDQLREQTGVDFRLVPQSEICSWPQSIVRWGWIKQQLAKIQCYQYCKTDYTWIVDGDVLITGDPELFSHGQPILRYDQQYAVPTDYKFFMQNYLGIDNFNDNTYVGSTCLFNRQLCLDLNLLCQKYSGFDIVSAVDHMLMAGAHPDLPFSEFECYGHMARQRNQHIVKKHNWNVVTTKKNPDWSAPIQISWAELGDDLDQRYQNLMRHRRPETVDQ